MTENVFWIREPGVVWVSDEYVYALVSALEVSLASVRSSWWAIGALSNQPRGIGPISSMPSPDLGRAHRALGQTMDDIQWLRGALVSYAQEVALQERSRVRYLEQPAERLMAVWSAIYSGRNPEGAWGDNPLGYAARNVAEGFPREHRVEVTELTSWIESETPPTSWGDRVSRIPPTSTPIRVERYLNDAGETHTEVYIAGTSSWGVGSNNDPFDWESNIALVAGLPAASLIGVQRALSQAGVKPGDPVTFTGHSQGGIIALRLAESGRYRSTGLFVVGAPLGTLSVSGSYPALALRHSDDVVPRLGGNDHTTGITTIERASGVRAGDIQGAHDKDLYQQSAEDFDSSPARSRLPQLPIPEGHATVRIFSARRVTD
jgi:hypothetical protein